MDENLNYNAEDVVNLNIGELIILEKQAKIVRTLLGSCISIIFFVPNKISIISHAQMPSNNDESILCKKTCTKFCKKNYNNKDLFKYVTCTLEYMIHYINSKGIKHKDLQVTLLGGASVIDSINKQYSIGELNVETAIKILKKHNIKISRKFTGGTSGMSLLYYSNNNKLIIIKHDDRVQFEL